MILRRPSLARRVGMEGIGRCQPCGASKHLLSDDALYPSSRAVDPHAVEAVAVGDDRGPEAATGAGATAALGGSPGTAVHQAVEL